jgi:SNF2 family DNA or RNA helicase
MIQRRKFEPRAYQRLAAKFLLDTKRANLWAKPGMGKTGTVYSALDILKMASSAFFPAIVLAPLKVAELVWPQEQKKWADFEGMRVATILGDVADREEALLRTGCDVFVINYDNIQWLVKRLGSKWPFRIVCADESTKLKNFRGWLDDTGKLHGNGRGGSRSAALAQIAQNTGRWMNLTGTPATNGLLDLWGQQWFLDHGQRLGRTFSGYKQRFFMTDPYTRAVTAQNGSEPLIHQLLADCTMALRPEDWMDIRQPITSVIEVDMPAAAKPMYKRMEKDYFVELGDLTKIEAQNALAKSTKLLQLAVGAIYDPEKKVHHVHDVKLDALESVVDECGGENILVGYFFKFDAPRIKARFPQAQEIRTEQDVADWNAGKIPIGLAHPASLGHGQNLQDGGRVVVFYSHTWDLELRLQFIERVGPTRQAQAGYNRAVLIYDLMTRGTIEREVLLRHEKKFSIQEALMLARATRNEDVGPTVLPVGLAQLDAAAGLI